MMKAEIYIKAENILGESPMWDHIGNNFLWVDIENKFLYISDAQRKDITQLKLESRVSAVALTNTADLYLLALETGLKLFEAKSLTLKEIVNPEKNLKNNRFNDGKCDPAGRFWVGSMDMDCKPKAANLYCLEGLDIFKLKLNNITISNGLDWSIDRKYMYYIDTADYAVRCFEYDINSGSISNPQIVITVPEDYGAPDGMCIDKEGMLWIAHWGGGNISRWNPVNGELLDRVEVPAPHVTSCCFGGKALDTLFITTARKALNEEQLKEYPQSGSVFSFQPDVGGFKTNMFHFYLNKKSGGKY